MEQLQKKIIEEELGQNTKDIFSSFQTKPMASASIAQVHPASLEQERMLSSKL
jgi:predicted unusual protein kinase regulating ubiquinone biosynthesis (AarF/ABC1/UbiB family)